MYLPYDEDIFRDYHKTINEINSIYYQVNHKHPTNHLDEITISMTRKIDDLINIFERKKSIKKQNNLEERLK